MAKEKPSKRWIELVFDMECQIGRMPSASKFSSEKYPIKSQVKHIARQAAWNACQTDGFCLIRCHDGIVTIIAGPDSGEVES